jgi:hypothetical protein
MGVLGAHGNYDMSFVVLVDCDQPLEHPMKQSPLVPNQLFELVQDEHGAFAVMLIKL